MSMQLFNYLFLLLLDPFFEKEMKTNIYHKKIIDNHAKLRKYVEAS